MKQLVVVLMVGIFLSGCISTPIKSDPSPKNKGTAYEYSNDNIPDICFFPVEKARWDGYKVTNKNWSALTDFQKTMFIGEWVEETEKNENVTIDAQ